MDSMYFFQTQMSSKVIPSHWVLMLRINIIVKSLSILDLSKTSNFLKPYIGEIDEAEECHMLAVFKVAIRYACFFLLWNS